MRTIEEIKADINKLDRVFYGSAFGRANEHEQLQSLYNELGEAIIECIPYERLEEICNAEREGRCVVLPCKIGEKVYRYCNDTINEGTIMNILLNVKTGEIDLEYEMPTCYTCSRSGTLGKNLFLTREEAEKALEERE